MAILFIKKWRSIKSQFVIAIMINNTVIIIGVNLHWKVASLQQLNYNNINVKYISIKYYTSQSISNNGDSNSIIFSNWYFHSYLFDLAKNMWENYVTCIMYSSIFYVNKNTGFLLFGVRHKYFSVGGRSFEKWYVSFISYCLLINFVIAKCRHQLLKQPIM